MAFADVSPAHQDSVHTLEKCLHDEGGINPRRAHDPHHPDMRGVLEAGDPRGISACIAAPVAKESQNPGLVIRLDGGCCFLHEFPYTVLLACFEGKSVITLTRLNPSGLKIRNPNIEARNKSKFQMTKIQKETNQFTLQGLKHLVIWILSLFRI